MGFPSVCCEYVLLPLVNKETALLYGRAEYNQPGRDYRESRQSQRDVSLPKDTDVSTLPGKPQPSGNTQNNRNRLI